MTADSLSIPILTFPREDLPVSMGVDGILFDGKPFPFSTVGTWRIEISGDKITTLHVEIAVKLGEVPDGKASR